MGRYTYEIYDPDELDLPNDIDFELEGIDEAYGVHQEYRAYLPDMLADLQPVSRDALDGCREAEGLMQTAVGSQADDVGSRSVSSLLLLDEAVSTTRIEGYSVSHESLLDYQAALHSGRISPKLIGEQTALDAVEALRDFIMAPGPTATLAGICAANELLARTSSRAELCGEIRERPVFIGESLFDADYVAPPADSLGDYMDDLVRFVNESGEGQSPVARAAIAQVHLITVHPFEDGNGRISRALSQRMLQRCGMTVGLVIPTSSFTLVHEARYIDAIQRYCFGGGPSDPSTFVRFYAEACKSAAQRVLQLRKDMAEMLDRWEHRMNTDRVERADDVVRKALEAFAATPVMTEPMLSSQLQADTRAILDAMVACGVLEQRSSRFCGVKIYVAREVIESLDHA